MKDQAQAVAEARKKSEELSAILADRRRQFEESVTELADFVSEAKIAVSRAEESLRQAGLAHYYENPTAKKLPFGCGVRVVSGLKYEPAAAYDWALEHKMALALDKKAFEAIAKAQPLPFVAEVQTVTVTLPADTAKLLVE